MKTRRSQHGITLITCMIMLVILTLLGLASIEDTSMEEKMAGNLRSRNLAFQAAESALRDGENYIASVAPLPNFDGTNGHYPQMDNVLTTMAASWSVGSAVRAYRGDPLPQVVAQPVYIIEQMEMLMPGGLNAAAPMQTEMFYRVTARALGGTDTTEVVLQSIYRR